MFVCGVYMLYLYRLFIVISCVYLVSPFLLAEKPGDPRTKDIQGKEIATKLYRPLNGKFKLEVALDELFVSLSELEQQGLFDGEVIVSQGGRSLFHLQSSDIASENPLREPQFMVGSVTKQFFAAALLKALYDSSNENTEMAKISDVKKKLHQPILRFLPKHIALWHGKIPAWARTVTLHHLLSHTSGIPNYTESERFNDPLNEDPEKLFFELPREPAEIINLIAHRPLDFEPGSRFSYSNTGYLLIAEVIESITMMPAADYVQKVLFSPIGLISTYNPCTGKSEDIKNDLRCSRLVPEKNYDPTEDSRRLYAPLHTSDISVAKGTGSIISTGSDLLKWNQSLHKSREVLPSALYKLMITENLDGYGYGIGIHKSRFGLAFGHQGSIGTYRSILWYFPDHDLSIVVLCHVCYDWDKVDEEYNALLLNLHKATRDRKKSEQRTAKFILKKYPPIRGFERIHQLLDNLFANS